MTAKASHLYAVTDQQQQGLALVTEAVDGHAYRVSLEGESLSVCGHLSQVDYLQCSDQVLVTSTPSGVIIVGRLRCQNEQPQPPATEIPEQLQLEAQQSICLKTAKSRIEIHGDGKILIDGQHIVQQAAGPVKMQGATIELN